MCECINSLASGQLRYDREAKFLTPVIICDECKGVLQSIEAVAYEPKPLQIRPLSSAR